MRFFMHVLLKIAFFFFLFYLLIQIKYIGLSLLLIFYVITSILYPPFTPLVLFSLYISGNLSIFYIFIIISALGFLRLLNLNKIYLTLIVIISSFAFNVLLFDIIYGLLLLPLYSLIGLALYYSLSKNKIGNFPFSLSISFLLMSIGALEAPHSLFYLSFFILTLSLINEQKASFLISSLVVYLNPLYFFLPILSIFNYYSLAFIIVLFYLIDLSLCLDIIIGMGFYLIILSIYNKTFSKKKNINYIYQNIVVNFNEQILKFASFLDNFQKRFMGSSKTKNRISDCFEILTNTFCMKCQIKDDCYQKYRNENYAFMKSALIYGNNIHYEKTTSELKDFNKRCNYFKPLIDNAHLLRNRYNLSNTTMKEKALTSQINGISNVLRQYAVDLTSKKELSLLFFLDFKEALIKNGYDVILFNVRKFFKNDFLIELGISNYQKKDSILNLANEYLKCETSIEYKKEINQIAYINVIPKITYQILYGTISHAKNNLNITGDNYLIKETNNGSFIAALSDGMGSGYKAYDESKKTLSMVDHITDFEVNVATSINMLNTFYSLKDNMDYYATLDLLEINQTSGEGILYKMGSSDSFIYSNKSLEIINNANLPCGIDDLISEKNFTLKNNDFILLMSDGIRDNLNVDGLKDIMLYSINKHPQKIAYEIMNSLIEKQSDDMSLIVIKIANNVI